MGDDVFVLDREENPHPRMLTEALAARQRAFASQGVAGERPIDEPQSFWRGYLSAMCAATGCDEVEMIAWLDSHQWRRGVGG